jgi:hypothetical protein
MFDFRKDAKKETAKNPFWKVQHLLDKLNENASNMWIPGKWLSIDEQTLGFQGRSGIKLRISYKKEGDGVQCNAICDEGYTFSFFFHHGDPPPLPSEFKNKVPDLSPTAQHVVWLALRLANVWSRIHGQPFQLPEVVHGALLGKESWARSRANHRPWSSPIGEAARGEECEGGDEAEGSYSCRNADQF